MNFEYDKSVNILANSWRLHVIQNESTKRKKHDREKKNFYFIFMGISFIMVA